jgi:hypothetical protein
MIKDKKEFFKGISKLSIGIILLVVAVILISRKIQTTGLPSFGNIIRIIIMLVIIVFFIGFVKPFVENFETHMISDEKKRYKWILLSRSVIFLLILGTVLLVEYLRCKSGYYGDLEYWPKLCRG